MISWDRIHCEKEEKKKNRIYRIIEPGMSGTVSLTQSTFVYTHRYTQINHLWDFIYQVLFICYCYCTHTLLFIIYQASRVVHMNVLDIVKKKTDIVNCDGPYKITFLSMQHHIVRQNLLTTKHQKTKSRIPLKPIVSKKTQTFTF